KILLFIQSGTQTI
ncbi:hypothetical protein, partial [Plasmodium yoelii yoelii]